MRWSASRKQRGIAVTAEATPHHFVLADTDIQPYDSNYKMKPPLRENGTCAACWKGLWTGPSTRSRPTMRRIAGAEKMQEFERCPFGIIGLETALGFALEQMYHPGHIDLASLVALFTHKPAGVLSLPGGNLRVGSPADVTIFGTGSRVDLRRKSVAV